MACHKGLKWGASLCVSRFTGMLVALQKGISMSLSSSASHSCFSLLHVLEAQINDCVPSGMNRTSGPNEAKHAVPLGKNKSRTHMTVALKYVL